MAVLTLPSEPASVAAARGFVRDLLASEDVDQVVATPAILLTSELVTNGVLHAETEIDLLVGIEGEALRVEVVDHGGGCPVAERPAPDAERGRGLFIVSRLATRWGVVLETERKSVWFELRCPRQPSRRERRVLLDALAAQSGRLLRRGGSG